MNRVKKTIVYLIVTSAALLLWYQTTPKYFSKDALVDAYLRGYHAGPAKETLLEYESQSGDTFCIVDCIGEPDYAFVMEKKAGLWEVSGVHDIVTPEDDYEAKYSTDAHLLFGKVKNQEAEQVHFKFSIRYYPGRWEKNEEGPFVISGTADVDENGYFYADFYDELTSAGGTNLWNGPDLQMIMAFDGKGNQLWSYQYEENQRGNISII